MTLTLEPVNKAEWNRIARQIKDMRERAQDVSPAWEALLTWFSEQNFQQFLTRGTRWRTPWRPLAASTVAEKARLSLPREPLIRTGRLVHSITLRPLGVEHITGREVSAGTNVPYARFHQTGTRRGLPARPLFSSAQIRREQAATTAVASWIIKGEAKVGGRTVLRGGR